MGLGGILDSLRQRGELKGGINDMVWGGRASDRAKSKLTVLEEVFTGSDDKLVQDVETALTRRDEFGRVLTPKEAYRQLCYAFHGVVCSGVCGGMGGCMEGGVCVYMVCMVNTRRSHTTHTHTYATHTSTETKQKHQGQAFAQDHAGN